MICSWLSSFFFFSSRRRHTRWTGDWSSDVCSSDLYLDELVFLFVPSADAQVLRFQSGETGVISRLGAENFSVLSRDQKDYAMVDAGPGLEYNFLFFNLNDLGEKAPPEVIQKQKWFRD